MIFHSYVVFCNMYGTVLCVTKSQMVIKDICQSRYTSRIILLANFISRGLFQFRGITFLVLTQIANSSPNPQQGGQFQFIFLLAITGMPVLKPGYFQNNLGDLKKYFLVYYFSLQNKLNFCLLSIQVLLPASSENLCAQCVLGAGDPI